MKIYSRSENVTLQKKLIMYENFFGIKIVCMYREKIGVFCIVFYNKKINLNELLQNL